jgi:hypothetical protein
VHHWVLLAWHSARRSANERIPETRISAIPHYDSGSRCQCTNFFNFDDSALISEAGLFSLIFAPSREICNARNFTRSSRRSEGREDIMLTRTAFLNSGNIIPILIGYAFDTAISCYKRLMAILEKFVQFAERLPADRLSSVETALAEIMESYSDRYGFTPSEQQTIDQRVAESSPGFSAPEDVATLFGKPFSA